MQSHESRQAPSWLIFDVRQTIGRMTMKGEAAWIDSSAAMRSLRFHTHFGREARAIGRRCVGSVVEDYEMSASCSREEVKSVFVLHPMHAGCNSDIASWVRSPNKTPEPTLGAARVFGRSVVFHLAPGVAHL